MAGTTLSDHAPITLESRKSQPKSKAFIRIPDHLILDQSLKEEATLIWTRVMASHGTTPERVTSTLQEMCRFFHGKATLKVKEYREKEKNLLRSLMVLQRLQKRHPTCSWISKLLFQAQQHIYDFEGKQDQFNFQKFSALWPQIGDRCNAVLTIVSRRPLVEG